MLVFYLRRELTDGDVFGGRFPVVFRIFHTGRVRELGFKSSARGRCFQLVSFNDDNHDNNNDNEDEEEEGKEERNAHNVLLPLALAREREKETERKNGGENLTERLRLFEDRRSDDESEMNLSD